MNFFSDSLTFSMDFVFVYIYDESGTPMAIRYASITSMSSELWHTLYLEKNMFGDVVAIYDEYGNKCISYTYDAWGNHTTTYHAGTTSQSIEAYNPFRYRGYYYDDETGLYYLNSRYYDPELGRFISPDSIIPGTSGSLHGYNLYAYCFNNPVNMTDASGNWPEWVENIGNFFYNIFDAAITSIEAQVGIGFGIGVNVSDTVTAEISRDTYVGIDDGQIVTGNVITGEMSLLDSKISLGDTYNHLVEKGGQRVSSSGSAWDGPFDMINYPDVTHGNQFSFLFISVNESGDLLLSASVSIHSGIGGHASIGFNITEFWKRLFD